MVAPSRVAEVLEAAIDCLYMLGETTFHGLLYINLRSPYTVVFRQCTGNHDLGLVHDPDMCIAMSCCVMAGRKLTVESVWYLMWIGSRFANYCRFVFEEGYADDAGLTLRLALCIDALWNIQIVCSFSFLRMCV